MNLARLNNAMLARECTRLGYPTHFNTVGRATKSENVSAMHLMGFSEALDTPLEDFFESVNDRVSLT